MLIQKHVVCGLLCLAMAGPVHAAEYYVTPTGAGSANGSSWANAFSNLQDAVDASSVDGDIIYLKYGSYSNAVQVEIVDHPGLFIKGGYEGTGDPPGGGTLSGSDTILTLAGGVTNRILYATNSVVTLDNLTVTGGYLAEESAKGINLLLLDCSPVVLTNCVVRDGYISGYDYTKGVGLYYSADGGNLRLMNSRFANNRIGASGNIGNFEGVGVYFSGASLVVDDTQFETNRPTYWNRGILHYGAGLYASATSDVTITNSSFIANSWYLLDDGRGRGAGLYLGGTADAVVTDSEFRNQYNPRGSLYGSALYADTTGALAIRSCLFSNNTAYAEKNSTSWVCIGGAIYRSAGPMTIEDCDFLGNRAYNYYKRASAIYLTGSAVTADVVNCVFDGTTALLESTQTAPQIEAWNSATLRMRDTIVRDSRTSGLFFDGSALVLSNCLFHSNGNLDGGDGIRLTNGTLTMAHCTLTDNSGWGLNRAGSGASGTVINSIAWDNSTGGITSNENLAVTYSCAQNNVYGSDNISEDPLFIPGTFLEPNAFYLSHTGLTAQTQLSPCRAQGSGTRADYGLTLYTTRSDGLTNTYMTSDMGYHYPQGTAAEADLSDLLLFSTNLFVDAINGTNSNTGLTVDQPLQTLTLALSRILADGTIHVATGTYSTAANDEAFPLTVAQSNLKLIGANRATTVVDAGAASRIFSADAKGAIHLEGITFRNGKMAETSATGINLKFLNCSPVVITNCAIKDGYITGYNTVQGVGIYYSAAGGTLRLVDSLVQNNRLGSGNGVKGMGLWFSGATLYIDDTHFSTNKSTTTNRDRNYGGGIYAEVSSALTVTNASFTANSLWLLDDAWGYGAGFYVSGAGDVVVADSEFRSQGNSRGSLFGSAIHAANTGALTIDSCVFNTNFVYSELSTWSCHGGAVYRSGGPITIDDSQFFGNYARNGKKRASAIYLTGAAVTADVVNCVFDGTTALLESTETAPQIEAVSSATLRMRDVIVRDGRMSGLFFDGSALVLSNCLFHANGSLDTGDGIRLTNGTLTMVHCTLTDNAGWGLNRVGAGASGTVLNSIAYANGSGGITSNENLTVTYSCAQNHVHGSDNVYADPLFIPGSLLEPNAFYLSHTGLTAQTQPSPCRAQGSGTRADYGLTLYTTRSDGLTNTYMTSDMGYHYPQGTAAEADLTELLVFSTNIFVDAINGTNTNTGLTIDQPLQTLTLAFSRIQPDGVIHVATGTYSTASNGEAFPLTVAQSNLRLIGANRDTTIIDANQADRVLGAQAKGSIKLEGLTFCNGRLSYAGPEGVNLYFDNSSPVIISNCTIKGAYVTGYTGGKGVGLYFGGSGGTLELRNSVVEQNTFNNDSFQGIGAYFSGNTLLIDNTAFTSNRATSGSHASSYGGALYVDADDAVTLSDCVFSANTWNLDDSGTCYGGIYVADAQDVRLSGVTIAGQANDYGQTRGAGLYAGHAGTLTIEACVFSNNAAGACKTYAGYGGGVYRIGGTLTITNSTFTGNSAHGGATHIGGSLYLTGSAVTTTVVNCTFDSRAVATNRGETIAVADSASLLLAETDIRYGSEEGIVFGGGWLAATNLLVAGCTNDGIRVTAGTVDLVNVTLAGNGGWGLSSAAGTVTLRNSIVWGNTAGSIDGTVTVTYSDIEGGHAGTENISTNPLFADAAAGDYHLQSPKGRWNTALADWVTTDTDVSPCIDAGDDDARWALEPEPNGQVINLGRYGGTAEASKSFGSGGSLFIFR
jgi:hypothetical protein